MRFDKPIERPRMSDRYASWFWYGRFEGANGGYIPPIGFGAFARCLYWLGNIVGRHFGPPQDSGNRT